MKSLDIYSKSQDEINKIINLVCMYYARLDSKDEIYKKNKSTDLSAIAEFLISSCLPSTITKTTMTHYSTMVAKEGIKETLNRIRSYL